MRYNEGGYRKSVFILWVRGIQSSLTVIYFMVAAIFIIWICIDWAEYCVLVIVGYVSIMLLVKGDII